MKRMFSYNLGRADARVYRRDSGGTYLVRFYVDDALRAAADYETDSLSDARGTAQAMVAGGTRDEPPMREVRAVWYVVGDEDNFRFDTKMDAERHARILYPAEDSYKRYARIFYQTVYTYEN